MDNLVLYVLVIIIVLVIFNVVVFAIAYRRVSKLNATKKACTQTAMARVVCATMEYPAWAKGRAVSYPIFEYSIANQPIRVKYKYSSIPNTKAWNGLEKFTPKYAEGMQVEIAYDPTDTERIYIPDDKEPYKFSRNMILASVITSIFFVVCILFFIYLAAS